MIPGIAHSLSVGSNPRKEQFKSSMCDICFTETAIHVDITARMFYCYNSFKKHPHGINLVKGKFNFENVVTIFWNS